MKQLITKIKTRKILSIMTIITIISLILGTLFISILSKDNKELITSNVIDFFSAIKSNNLNYNQILVKSLTNNLLLNIIIWLLGISIIGIPIVIILLFIKSFILSFTFTSIIYTYKYKGIISAIIYVIPHIINLLLSFVLIYYSITFSKSLFNYLFKKKECNRKELVNRYLKLLVISTFLFIISSIIETYIIPILIRLF